MNLKRLLALLLAFGMAAAACGGGSDEAGDDTDTDTSTETDADGGDEGGDEGSEGGDNTDPTAVETDFGVTDDVIKIGINGDLSGPFSSLVVDIVLAQETYWDWVNDNGGIGGRQVELVVLDSGYATDQGIENYQELAQESEDGVLMISETTGSPITAAIAEDLVDDDMLTIPLSWASLWPGEDYFNVMEKNATYCAESFNGVAWLAEKVESEGKEPTLAILSRPGEYGDDGAAGAAIAADLLGIEVVYDGTGQVAGDDRTAIISQLVGSGATMVWTVLTPGELADVFGGAVSQGFEGIWSGNQPSFSYKALLGSDLAPAFDQYYYQSDYLVPWNGNDSEGMQEMVSVMTERNPDAILSNAYVSGWLEGIMVQTVIEQAIANGDLTRAGMVEALGQVEEFDFKGLSPNQTYQGSYDEVLVRETYIYDVVADEFNLAPLSSGEGGTGLVLEEGPFVSDILADYEFGGPCI